MQASTSSTSDSKTTRVAAATAIVYALLIVWMRAPFTFSNGMPHETAFPYMSDTGPSVWRGFLYEADPLRIHTSTFYHLSYVLSQLAGVPGSFVPYQIVYAILWWARGLLVFLILRRLFPEQVIFCYTAGALVLVHASDQALQWIGQMNHFGFIFWMLLAFYVFIVAAQAKKPALIPIYLLLACLFEYMSLWSYESQFFIMVVFPILFLLVSRPVARRQWVLSGVWYLTPLVYVYLTATTYFRLHKHTYQETIIRSDWSFRSLLSDLLFNVRTSLSVWSWNGDFGYLPRAQSLLLSISAALTFIAGGVFLIWLLRRRQQDTNWCRNHARVAWKILAAGLILVVMSFPAYLLLNTARTPWRTQFLSGIGAGIVLGAVMALTTCYMPRKAGWTLFFGLAAAVVFWGGFCAVERGGFHRAEWTRHRRTIASVLRVAPQVKPETMFVLVNVPSNADPFYANDWFDTALRLAYPGTPVAGVYFHEDLTPVRGANQRLDSNRWHWDGTPLAPVVTNAGLEQTIVLDYRADGAARILQDLPPFVCRGGCTPQFYRPQERIAGYVPSPRAVNRYGPL